MGSPEQKNNTHQAMRQTLRVNAIDQNRLFSGGRRGTLANESLRMNSYNSGDEDHHVDFKIAKFEDKLKEAEERYLERQASIVASCQNRSLVVA